MNKDDLKDLIELDTLESNIKFKDYVNNSKKPLCDQNYIFPNGETFLHWACAYNNKEICEYCLTHENPIHVNIQNFRGTTPLYYAAMNNSKDVIDVLLKYNVNPMMRSGFSGLFPHELGELDEIYKTKLQEFEQQYIPLQYYSMANNQPFKEPARKNKFNLYTVYHYSSYMNFLSATHSIFSVKYSGNHGQNILNKISNLHATEIYNNQGIMSLFKECDRLNEFYIKSVDVHRCLYCNKKENLKRCSLCKEVYYCDRKCQEKSHFIHKQTCNK
jgi:hypothetical protein